MSQTKTFHTSLAVIADIHGNRWALEAILQRHANGQPGGVVFVNAAEGGLVQRLPGVAEPVVLYEKRV